MPTNQFLSNPAPGQYVYNSNGRRQDTWKCGGLCLAYVGGKCWEHWPWLWWDFGRLRRSWTWSSLHPELQPVDVCNRSCVIFFREYWNVLQLYCDCTCHHAACLASSDVLVMYSTTRTSLSTLQAGASIVSFEKASLIKTPPDSIPDRSFNELNWVDTFWILAAGGQWQHGPNHGRTLSSSITRSLSERRNSNFVFQSVGIQTLSSKSSARQNPYHWNHITARHSAVVAQFFLTYFILNNPRAKIKSGPTRSCDQ